MSDWEEQEELFTPKETTTISKKIVQSTNHNVEDDWETSSADDEKMPHDQDTIVKCGTLDDIIKIRTMPFEHLRTLIFKYDREDALKRIYSKRQKTFYYSESVKYDLGTTHKNSIDYILPNPTNDIKDASEHNAVKICSWLASKNGFGTIYKCPVTRETINDCIDICDKKGNHKLSTLFKYDLMNRVVR